MRREMPAVDRGVLEGESTCHGREVKKAKVPEHSDRCTEGM